MNELPSLSSADKKIEYWKSQLIDLSMRNRLLHFRPTKLGTVRIIQPSADGIFNSLVREEKLLTFAWAGKEPEVQPEELVTPLSDPELARVLYNLRLKSRTALQEQGVNVLFIAFGLLEWQESPGSGQKVLSPLILAPVELIRDTLTSPYKLSLLDEEVVLNPALIQRLQVDFGIALPRLPDVLDSISLQQAFAEVKEAVEAQTDWSISSETYVGLFAFTKLVMYKDLEIHADLAKSHPIVSALAGDPSRLLPIPDDLPTQEALDDEVPPEECFQVLDADSSQQEAIIAAKRDVSFVLQGPPGTGKSQTITNIIAECLAVGKTVLFVSEKMAALEVVKKRLDNCGLGQFCLELHSHKASKRAVIAELGRTLDSPPGLSASSFGDAELRQLQDLREKLNRYVRALHKPQAHLKRTAFGIHGELARLQDAPDLVFDFPNVLRVDPEQLRHIGSLLKRVAAFPQVLEEYDTHPWRGSHVRSFTFQLLSDVRVHFDRLKTLVLEIDEVATELARMVHLGQPKTLEDIRDLISLLSSYDGAVLSLDLPEIASRLENSYRTPLRLLKLSYWRDVKTIRRVLREGTEMSMPETLGSLKLAAKVSDRLGANKEEQQEGPARPQAFDAQLALVADLTALMQKAEEEFVFLGEIFPIDEPLIAGASITKTNLPTLRDWLQDRLDNLDKLHEWIDFQNAVKECEQAGLREFISASLTHKLAADQLERAFHRRFYQLWLDAVYAQDDALRNFNSRHHRALIAEFRRLDRKQMQIARVRIQHRVAARRPDSYWVSASSSEQTILRREMVKKRRHKPIRKLFSEIPNLLFALKPCFLMSPLSVSQFLDANIFRFDVVVFDEASQICPEDAIGAIVRARQVIIVGDSKQLPPTRFFSSLGVDDFEDEEAAEMDVFESILDESTTIGLPSKRLLWHYRSQNESLIAFSNYHFYDNRLITFPNAKISDEEFGIEFVYVPEGVYDRGKSRTNVVEAQKVAELVFNHFENFPEHSLGVVAFSQAQESAIRNAVEKLREQRPEYEPFFDESRPESFFVKNLEHVQGDERDVMFFSVGYGKDSVGRMSLNFGPLNSEGGHRRLNVAITRARYHIKLIASIQPTDIDLSRAESRGAQLLCAYMEFAQRRGETAALWSQIEVNTAAGFESPFEEEVWEALTEHGLTLDKQVGCSGYRIDLAVKDPKNQAHYLLGIECDGATYHSAKTARDRDRLRQQVLESLGWRIHRIWSRDWVENPGRELEKVLEAVQEASLPASSESVKASEKVNGSNNNEDEQGILNEDSPQFSEDQHREEASRLNELPHGVEEYKRFEILEMADLIKQFAVDQSSGLEAAVVRLVQQEGPVHIMSVSRRVAEFSGMSRTGSRVQSIVLQAAQRAKRRGRIRVEGEFLWPVNLKTPPVRRPPAGENPRDIEEIALEEIAQAAYLCIENAFSIQLEDLIVQTARLLGYDRTGPRIRRRIDLAVKQLLRTSGAESDGNMVKITAKPNEPANTR